jgi:hypothetical protein
VQPRHRWAWPCQHATHPGGPSLVDTLLRHGVDATTLECPDVHELARSLARSRYVALADRRLLVDESPAPALPAPHFERRSLYRAIALAAGSLAAGIFVLVFFGKLLWPW